MCDNLRQIGVDASLTHLLSMNIKEAASFLGMSVKTLERRIAAGDISVAYTPGARGRLRTFDESELQRFQEAETAKVSATTYVARPRVASVVSDAPEMRGALQLSANGKSAALVELIAAIDRARAVVPLAVSVTDLAHKLTLSLIEAAKLSGLSRGHLRFAIEEKKLKARIIGRGWRVKREDLEAYIKKL
jgi:excisionase family DNA binding protein